MDTLHRGAHRSGDVGLPGQHICAVVDGPDERRQWAAAWAGEGLAAGERVISIQPVTRQPAFLDLLTAAGVGWHTAAESGQLLLVAPEHAYLDRAGFDPGRRIVAHAAFVERSVRDGYPGVRVTVEASIALSVMRHVDRLLEYEGLFESLSTSHPVSGLCLYDPNAFADAMGDVVAAHPRALGDRLLRGWVEPGRVVLRGELDMANAGLVAALFERAEPRDGWLRVDASDCTFIDMGNTTKLVALARRLRPGARVRVIDPPPQLAVVLRCVGWQDELELDAGEATT